MKSGLQSRVEDHSNITMFNFIAYPIFKRKKKKNATQHHDTDSKHPVKTIKGKITLSNSLSLSLLSHFKRAQLSCHSFSYDEKKKKRKRTPGITEVSKQNEGEKLCVPPMTMVWYCSKWNDTNTPPPPPSSKHLPRPRHAQVRVKVSDLTAN